MSQVVAFSGGKDSTALVLRMAELGEAFECLFTPTGNELFELAAHIDRIVARIDRPLVLPPNQTLRYWIDYHQALPNWRMRWCTRQIKIEPCIAYLKAHPGSILCVGLRADEEDRDGLYGDYAYYRYPLQEWDWGIDDVWRYLGEQGVTIPERTDCALCYAQRLGEWWRLWKNHPEEFEAGVQLEQKYGHTFRSAQRDTWPAALIDLRREFEQGRVPRGAHEEKRICRVCTL
jgi:3'-phosphoadenosine 5'-phosphosulfate sulfotransferase (PAPS reductase)/FAD synthetase